MESKKYLIIAHWDGSMKITGTIDNVLEKSALNGDISIIDITGAKDPREMAFPGNDAEWWSIADDSESSD